MARPGKLKEKVMRKIIIGLATIALSGCGSLPKPVPEPLSVTVKSIADAAREGGCAFNFSLGAGGSSGQLGGAVHAENSISGGCDPSKASKPISLITTADLAGE